MPPSVDASKRVLAYRVPRGVVGVITPWNWPYTMPAELIAPALAAGNAVVWTPASSTVGLRGQARRVHRRRGAAGRRLQHGHRPGRGRRRRGRGEPGDAGDRLHRLDRDRAAGRRAGGGQGAAARAGRQRPDGRARRRRRRRRGRGEHRGGVPLRRPELHGGRALPRPRGRPRRVRRAAARGGRSATSGSATRSTRRRRWARSTTSRPRRRWTATSPTRSSAARSRRRRQRAPPASRRGSTGRRRCSTASPTRWRSRARRRSARSSRSRDLARRGGAPARELVAVRAPDRGLDARPRARPALRRGGARRLGEHQRVDELLGEPPPVRRSRRLESGLGRVGGRSVLDAFTEQKTVVLTLD